VYGQAKLAGDQRVAAAGGPHLIFRTSWVYGARGVNFLRTIRRLARSQPVLRVVDDQRGAPTWSRAVAQATAAVAQQLRTEAGFALDEERWGVYHLSAGGETTWYEFACEALREDPAPEELVYQEIQPITTEEWGAPARRPLYSVLDNSRLARTFGIALPHWKEQFALLNQEAAEAQTQPSSL
jgi:dTDP-4-dehydrorhamnose reductase